MITAEQARACAAKIAREKEVQALMDGPITDAIKEAAESGKNAVVLNLTPYYSMIPYVIGSLKENGFDAAARMSSALVEVSW